ncbi:MAG: AraC family transcriptional regulator [Pseudodesulfovibrio sp.]
MRDTTQNIYYERMLRVLAHIQVHLDDELSLESLAATAHFSTTHFHRIFKGMMGETVAEHVRRIRMERAAMRLICRQSSVTGAAFDAGYETVESFSRAFSRMFGCAPSRYRRKHWEALQQRLPGIIHYQPDGSGAGLAINPQGGIPMDVRIENIPAAKGIFVRHTGPYAQCGPAWETLCAWAAPRGLCRNDTRYIGVSHDDPQVTPPDKIRYDACITVNEDVTAEGRIGIQTIGGGPYAVFRHKGPYSGLERVYARLMGQWLPRSGREFEDAKPCFEVYLNHPDATPPEELLTDVCLPLK